MKKVKNAVLFVSAAVLAVILTAGGVSAVPAVVELASENQVIRGFGGMNHPIWIGDLTAAQRDVAFGNGENQLGFTVVRIFVSDNRNDWQREVATAKNAYDRGHLVFASPWNPPSAMTETFNRDAQNPNAKRLRRDRYAEYAQHLDDFVTFMRNNGVELYAISIQNEPDYAHEWTWWTPTEMVNFLKNNARSINCRIIAPESFQYRKTESDPILNDAQALANMDILGAHLYGTQYSAFPYPLFKQRGAGKELWMTEVYYPNSSDSANTWPQALDVAQHIHSSMADAEFQMYVWWYIRRFYGPMFDNGTISKRGYMMAHFSKFVRPGYIRVTATKTPETDLYVSAYKGKDSVAIVAVNKRTSNVNQVFTINGGTVTTMTGRRTSGTENMVRTANLSVSNGSFTAELPARSVTTFTGALRNATNVRPDDKNVIRGYSSLMTVRGRTLAVNGAADSKVRIRIVNLTGRTVAAFNTHGGADVSLRKVPAGTYVVEAKRAKDGVKMMSTVVLR